MNYKHRFKNLCNWINENGGYVSDKIDIEETIYGRSIKCKSDIDPDEILFNLPKKLLLNKENLNLKIDGDNFNEKCTVVISLLLEIKNEESFWQPYIDILPHMSELEKHPLILHMSNKFPKISETLNNNLYSLQEDLYNIFNFINDNFKIEGILTEEIIWAYLIVTTRMWKNFGLVPLADLFQHKNNSTIYLKNTEDDFIGMKSDHMIQSGETIFDNYNINDDTVLFTNYGFIDKSEDPRISITFDDIETKLDEKTYLSLNSFRDQNLFYSRLINLSKEDIILEKYKNRLEDSMEIKSVQYLIDKINKLPINSDIRNIKLKKGKYSKNSIDSQIIELVGKMESIIKYNIDNLERYKSELNS
jgi:hypothetical protein